MIVIGLTWKVIDWLLDREADVRILQPGLVGFLTAMVAATAGVVNGDAEERGLYRIEGSFRDKHNVSDKWGPRNVAAWNDLI
jgi:hypothetical protein